MGIQSQHRISGIRACKNRSRRSRYSSSKSKRTRAKQLTRKQEALLLQGLYYHKMKQATLWNRAAPPTVGNGGIICDGCRFGPTFKKGHHITCHFSKYYGKSREQINKELEKANAPKPPPIVYNAQPARLRVDFITGKSMARTSRSIDKENSPPTGVVETIQEEVAVTREQDSQESEPIVEVPVDDACFIEDSVTNQIVEECSVETDDQEEVIPDTPINMYYDSFSAPALKAALKSRLSGKCPPYKARCSKALFEITKHIVEMFPSNFDSKSNKI